MKRTLRPLTLLGLAALGVATLAAGPMSKLKPGDRAIPFAAKDMTGRTVSLSGHRGKVVLLDFWATWCPPCRGEVPNTVAVYNKYHARGLDIIGVSLDEDRNALVQYTRSNKMTWPQVFDGKGWKAEVAGKYGVQAIPATYLIDGTTGRVIAKDLRGPNLDSAVARALAKKR